MPVTLDAAPCISVSSAAQDSPHKFFLKRGFVASWPTDKAIEYLLRLDTGNALDAPDIQARKGAVSLKPSRKRTRPRDTAGEEPIKRPHAPSKHHTITLEKPHIG